MNVLRRKEGEKEKRGSFFLCACCQPAQLYTALPYLQYLSWAFFLFLFFLPPLSSLALESHRRRRLRRFHPLSSSLFFLFHAGVINEEWRRERWRGGVGRGAHTKSTAAADEAPFPLLPLPPPPPVPPRPKKEMGERGGGL